MGEGGIPSTQSIPESARDAKMSYMGYIGNNKTPRVGQDRGGFAFRHQRP
ncbi:MAG: hypothetical protein R3B84_20845 [Zavarzinella sp.]